jgi:phosphosulfolactate synthase (CoM biosynthesis protein A)
MRRALIAVACTVALAGCGGGATTVDSMAKKVGCIALDEPAQEMYVQAKAKCYMGDQTVEMMTFKDNDARDSYVQVASTFGGQYVRVDSGVYAVQTQTALDMVQQRLNS